MASPPLTETPVAPTPATSGPAGRAGRVLAGVAVGLGLLLLAAGQYALADEMQAQFDRSVDFAWLLRIPLLGPRLGPGVIGLVLGALLVGAGLRRLVPTVPPREDVPPSATRGSPRLGRALIALGALVSAALCAHILLARPEEWDDQARRALFYAFLRPGAFILSVALAGAGCALFGRRRPGIQLPFDLADAGWIAAMAVLFVALVTPTLENWRYSFIGDEYSFYLVAYELYSGRPFDIFWQAGVYSTHPLMSSWIPALTMRLLGADAFGWKSGLVLMAVLTIPITYLTGRWLFDRTTALAAAGVVATSHYLFAYSHTGHNNIDSVPWVILTAGLVGVALLRPSPLLWFAAGATAGFSLYWFFAARVAGPMLALAMLQRGPRRFLEGLAPALLGCAIVAAPFVARNQSEVITRMLVESVTTKPMPLGDVLVEALRLTGLSALAFHWSTAHGLYLSLGLLDPFSAVLSLVGVVGALLRWRDWRRRTMVIWYLLILLITGGLARHSDISVPRLLVAVPLLALFAGDAVSQLLRAPGLIGASREGERMARLSTAPRLRTALAGAVVVALVGVFAVANVHRFRVVTPARNETMPEMMAMAGLYSPECRQAGPFPLLIWGGRGGGALPVMLSSWEPNRYEPMIVTEAEYRDVAAYRRWPCVVVVDPASPLASTTLAAALGDGTGARGVVIRDDAGRKGVQLILHPPLDTASARPPLPNRFYAVAETNQRRGAAFGALAESADLAIGPNGHWYVADPPNHRLTEYDADAHPLALWGAGRLDAPSALAADDRGLAVIDHGSKRVVLFDPDGRVVRSASWADLGLGLPRGVALQPDGALVVADEGNAEAVRFDRELRPLGKLLEQSTEPDQARGMRPTEVRAGADGGLFVYEGNTFGRVRRYGPDGRIVGTWETGVREGRLAVAPDGGFWVGGPHGRPLLRFGPNGQKLGEYPPAAFLGGIGEGGASGLAVDSRGLVVVAWRYLGAILYRPPGP